MFPKSGFSEGYKIKNGKNVNDKQININKLEKNSFPNGLVPFIFIYLFYVIFLACVFGIGFSNYKEVFSIKQTWTNSLISISIAPILFNFLWTIGRTGFNDAVSFSLLKFSRFTKIAKIREKVEFYVHEPAIKNVNNLEDFKIFSKKRKQNSTKWFYISWITSIILFVVVLIPCLVVQNIN